MKGNELYVLSPNIVMVWFDLPSADCLLLESIQASSAESPLLCLEGQCQLSMTVATKILQRRLGAHSLEGTIIMKKCCLYH